jgi:hypothetical protein
MAKWHANFDKPTVGGARLIDGLLERGLLNDGSRIPYAFGISHATYRGLPTIGHGGSDAGYRSAFLRFPEQRFGVASLCNIASANPTRLVQRVADVYLAERLAAPAEDAGDSTPEVTLPPEQLQRYAGLYWNDAEASSRRFEFGDGRLHAVAGSQRSPLKPVGDGRFIMTTGPRTSLAFEGGANGSDLRLRVGGPDGPGDVFLRAEPFTPSAKDLEAFAGTYRSDEIEAVFRMVVHEGALRLERLKSRPAPLTPLVRDTFTTQAGTIRFVRDAAGNVTGFQLDAGRVRHVKFSKVI